MEYLERALERAQSAADLRSLAWSIGTPHVASITGEHVRRCSSF
jgi:hypothetical protein